MKALSFHQPRAEQIVRGVKTVDVRTWQVQYRGTLAVHASSERRDRRSRELGFDPEALAYGALIGAVDLVEIVSLDEPAYEALRGEHLLDAPFPGAPCYGWRFANPRRFEPPIPCVGRRRLFEAAVVGRDAIPPYYCAVPPPQPDPERPFALYAIAEKGADVPATGYRVALYQWLQRNGDPQGRAPGALWSVELGGDRLRAVADHLLAALRANGYKATDLARAAGSETPFYLDELTGVRLALVMLAVKPLTSHERIEAIGQGVQAMGDEEAYYWFSKCSAGPDAARAQKALRVLLAGE